MVSSLVAVVGLYTVSTIALAHAVSHTCSPPQTRTATETVTRTITETSTSIHSAPSYGYEEPSSYPDSTLTTVSWVESSPPPYGQPPFTPETSSLSSSTSLAPSTISSRIISSSTSTVSSSVIPTPTPTCSPPPGAPKNGVLRGVNIGGWLLLEKWITPSLFDGTDAEDQWTFDQTPHSLSKLQEHWETFFTLDDVSKLACWGFNALRIPIGFWAYNAYNELYHSGADDYLEQALIWARAYNMRVLIDLHGAPGSQNGFDSSGHAGNISWQTPRNLERTINILTTMAEKYSAEAYRDVVLGFELVNEPASWPPNDFEVTQKWAVEAYNTLLPYVEDTDLVLVMHDSFRGEEAWLSISERLNGGEDDDNRRDVRQQDDAPRFALDVHRYQLFDEGDNDLNQTGHIRKACGWADPDHLSLFKARHLPIYVGEWTAATNICAFPDNSTAPGTVCEVEGCQCENVDVQYWFPWLKRQARMYVEAQLEAFERSTNGWFYWNYKGPGAWSLESNIQAGVFPNPIWEREFEAFCE